VSHIHPTAIVDPRAKLAADVTVGPYTIIDGDVQVGEGTSIGAHCVITGHTAIGRENRIFHFCSIGEANQDKKYAGEPTRLAIGDRNTIREYCHFNRGTVQDAGVTSIGSDNWFMAYVHIAHDCIVGNQVTLANSVQLAGHVHMGDWATVGGLTGIHQYVHLGAHVMVAAASLLVQDVPPYVLVGGNPLGAHGINSEGLKRRGFSPDTIAALKRAYRTLYKAGLTIAEAKEELLRQSVEAPDVRAFVEFLDASTRGIVR
jgi:UDP-N-acetylglucosamine acyltransferase